MTTLIMRVLLIMTSAAWARAEAVTSTVMRQTVVQEHDQAVSEAAARWGLSDREWQQYLQVMTDRRGVWSPGLDPITALGVSADTASERHRYAELYVRTEFERTRKELAFQLAVDQAWHRLYPDTKRIARRSSASDSAQPPVRYALIVKSDCVDCKSILNQRLPGMIGEAEEGVDVHVVGTDGDDSVLESWMSSQPALLAALKKGRATVNHGGQFQDLRSFPAIYSKTGKGQWIREL